MLTISKPLSAGQAQSYHQKEFTAKEQNYWSQRGETMGEWQGRLAERFGLTGTVAAEEFARLSQGQHPQTGEQLVRQRASYEYKDGEGNSIKTMEHRAGWDATFSAPKSVSLTALVGGDYRVREAHREAVRTALEHLEHYTLARIGGNHQIEANESEDEGFPFYQYFAHTPFSVFRRVSVPIQLPDETRFAGMWVLAPQGRGKTTLLHSMVAQDIDKDASII